MTATASPRYRPAHNLAPPGDSAPTSAPRLPCPDSKSPEQKLSRWAEHRRLTLLADTQKRWAERARQATSEGSHLYAAARARSLRTPLGPRIARCGTVSFEVACARRSATVPRACRQWWLCASCRRRRSNGLRGRMTAGLKAAWSRMTAGGERCGLRLVTLTVRHSGDVDKDRRALADGWRAFYKSLRDFLAECEGERWRRMPYVASWEVTPGADGRGHVHLHLVVIWPRFVPYGKVRTLWLRACPQSERIHIAGGSNAPDKAANYLAKYISKGVEVGGFSEELQASVLASFYNAHLVLTSRGFWLPKVCACCGAVWRRVVPSWLESRQGVIADVLAEHGASTEPRAAPDERGSGGGAARLL